MTSCIPGDGGFASEGAFAPRFNAPVSSANLLPRPSDPSPRLERRRDRAEDRAGNAILARDAHVARKKTRRQKSSAAISQGPREAARRENLSYLATIAPVRRALSRRARGYRAESGGGQSLAPRVSTPFFVPPLPPVRLREQAGNNEASLLPSPLFFSFSFYSRSRRR